MPSRKNEKGASLLLVLVTLALLLFGAITVARFGEAGTRLAGNVAEKEASRQAAQVGVETAFAALKALTDLETSASGYFAVEQADLTAVSAQDDEAWSSAPSVTVERFTVKYLVERLCRGTLPVTDPLSQCFVKQDTQDGSAKANTETLEAPARMQYRINVLVTSPKGTVTLIQQLVTL